MKHNRKTMKPKLPVEYIDGKRICFEYETPIELQIPHHVKEKALQAVNHQRLGRALKMEDDENTFGVETWKALNHVHWRMAATQIIRATIKVDEDGGLHCFLKQ